jgi:hypothetical protein
VLRRFRAAESPDPAYFDWCASDYDEAAARMEPMVHDVQAVVRRWQQPPFQTRYRRLLIPLKDRDGGTIMVIGTRQIG